MHSQFIWKEWSVNTKLNNLLRGFLQKSISDDYPSEEGTLHLLLPSLVVKGLFLYRLEN